MISFEKLERPTKGTKIELKNGQLQIPDDPIIPFIAGDGIGPDIWNATRSVVDAVVEHTYGGKKRIEWFEIHAGLSALVLYGNDEILPEDTLKAINYFHVAIKGPLTTPVGSFEYVCLSCSKEQNGIDGKRPKSCINCGSEHITPRFRSLNVSLRQSLDLYACVRPVRWFKGVPAPVKAPEKLNVVIFRENSEDVYSGIEFEKDSKAVRELIEFVKRHMNRDIRPDSGIGCKPISLSGTQRIVRKAIQFALEQGKSSVTLVHKGNIMKFTEGAFRDWGYDLAKDEFRDKIVTESEVWDDFDGKVPEGKLLVKDRIADQMFQQLLLRPDEYSIIATMNLNGDYLSDACAAQVGGLGLAPGANIGDEAALFEATHGTAPKYTGMDKVNPSSLLLSAVLMLRYLGWGEAADNVIKGIEAAIQKKTVTYDLARQMDDAETVSCSEFGKVIVNSMKE